ncbi:hypothetical protein [Clostridium drakei]|uniref:Uncharacterized protein n=1 Tax=Clostridium drakei TaxID=332101 RepID=A0A2U8DK35_9CLOT|nr:hypothetical protein [Clostridium drakei]AWI03126.1 hypothetical protein B9W14_00925 [Clostridium drakei]
MGEAVKKAMYDDKVELILKGLTEGKSREELAEELEYKNYKSLDMYMRRKNWRWNQRTENYEEQVTKATFEDRLDQVRTIGTKAGRVIDLFNSGIEDPMEIAKKAGFRNHIEMANYMTNKNYVWNNELGNYGMKTGKLEDKHDKLVTEQTLNVTEETDIKQFIPILKVLQNNKDKIVENLTPELQTNKIPTYLVPGIATILSAQMMSSLKFLLREFSNEKNITQRQILEVALIEFFNKYGYSYRVKEMFNA